MAIGRPPSRGIDKTAAQVHRKLAEVSSEAMFHLHKRSQSIHVTVRDSNTQIKDLQRQNKVLVHAYEHLAANYDRFREEVESRYPRLSADDWHALRLTLVCVNRRAK
jgi:hypothetical protein